MGCLGCRAIIASVLIFISIAPEAQSASVPAWEMIVIGAYDPSVGGKHITITRTLADGIFKVRMDVPNYFSWRDVDSDGQHPSSKDMDLSLFLNAWNVIYVNDWPDAELYIVDYATKLSKRVAIKMGKPTLDSGGKSISFRAKFRKSTSSLLASIRDDASLPQLAKTMPLGQVQGMGAIWIENSTGIPHDNLSKGIKFVTKKTRPISTSQKYAVGYLSPKSAASQILALDTSSKNLIMPTGNCTAENVTMDWVISYNKARPDLKDISGTWTDDQMLAISRAYMLPCDPVIVAGDVDEPQNVKRVRGILTKARWDDLTTQKGLYEANSLTKDEIDSYSYENFLRVVGKYPFFCAEQGVSNSLDDACRRELASIFAHAAQEVGAHDKALYNKDKTQLIPEWKQAFAYMFEQNCYSVGVSACQQYNPGNGACPAGYSCSKDYYGRGIKQISYYYNYMSFGGQILGNPGQLLADPDSVGKNGLLGIGSGIWFHMTPQPPKPSMHDVITGGGGYAPAGSAQGLDVVTMNYVDWQGANKSGNSPSDKFMASISLINGGVECSPESKIGQELAPGVIFTKDNANDARQRGINRMVYYGNLLTYFDLSDSSMTQLEKGYKNASLTGSVNGCNVGNGNPFADPSFSLIYNPPWYVVSAVVANAKKCIAQTWAPAAPFNVAAESSYDICKASIAASP